MPCNRPLITSYQYNNWQCLGCLIEQKAILSLDLLRERGFLPWEDVGEEGPLRHFPFLTTMKGETYSFLVIKYYFLKLAKFSITLTLNVMIAY